MTNEKVPLFSSWRKWYWFVIALLLLEIFLFYLITKLFA